MNSRNSWTFLWISWRRFCKPGHHLDILWVIQQPQELDLTINDLTSYTFFIVHLCLTSLSMTYFNFFSSFPKISKLWVQYKIRSLLRSKLDIQFIIWRPIARVELYKVKYIHLTCDALYALYDIFLGIINLYHKF